METNYEKSRPVMTGEVKFRPEESYQKSMGGDESVEYVIPANAKMELSGSPKVEVATAKKDEDAQAIIMPKGEMDGEDMPAVLLGKGGLPTVTLQDIGTFSMVVEK